MSDVDVWCGVRNSVLFSRSFAISGHPGILLGVFCKHIPWTGPGGHSIGFSYSSAGRYMQLQIHRGKKRRGHTAATHPCQIHAAPRRLELYL